MALGGDPRLKEHPAYTEFKADWQFFLDSYECGRRYIKGKYLFQHPRELPGEYAARLKRAAPASHARSVINFYKALISRKEVSRTTDSPDLQFFFNVDADWEGHPLGWFIMQRVFPIAQAAGFAWVLVDMPKPLAPLESRADEIEQEIRPYIVRYKPTDVINWAVDISGAFTFVTLALKDANGKAFYRVWSLDDVLTFDDKKKLVLTEPNELGKVPFVRVYNEQAVEEPNVGVSAIQNIAYWNRRIYNTDSLIDEFLHKQCFNIAILPAGIETEKGQVSVGNANAIKVPPNSTVQPSYLTPPVAPAEYLLKTREEDIAAIYHEAGLAMPQASIAEAKSGVALSYEFHNTNTLLADKAKNLQEGETAIARFVLEWLGTPDVEFTVKYETDFDVRDVQAELDQLERVLKLNLDWPSAKRERARRAVPHMFPNLEESERDKILEEINAETFLQTQQQQPEQGGFFQRFRQAAA